MSWILRCGARCQRAGKEKADRPRTDDDDVGAASRLVRQQEIQTANVALCTAERQEECLDRLADVQPVIVSGLWQNHKAAAWATRSQLS